MMDEAKKGFPVSWKAHLHDLPRSGRAIAIRASDAERAAIARFADLPEVRVFNADLLLTPARGGGVRVAGTLHADVVQSCVVSLRPVEGSLDVEFYRSYAPQESRRRGAGGGDEIGELVIAFDEADPPEPMPRGDLDLAEFLVEEFLLALDPYPRHPDAALEPSADEGDDNGPKKSPFAGLEALKGGKKEPKA